MLWYLQRAVKLSFLKCSFHPFHLIPHLLQVLSCWEMADVEEDKERSNDEDHWDIPEVDWLCPVLSTHEHLVLFPLQDDSILQPGKSINLSPLVRQHCKFEEAHLFTLSFLFAFSFTTWCDLILAKHVDEEDYFPLGVKLWAIHNKYFIKH